MNKIRRRIANALTLAQGPYVKRSSVEILLTATSALNQSFSKVVQLESLAHEPILAQQGVLPVELSSVSGKLLVKFPKTSALKKATFLGWETFWKGTQSENVDVIGDQLFEMALPAEGWWQISTPSVLIDIQTLVQTQQDVNLPLSTSLKHLLLGKQTRTVLFAGIAHLSLLLVAANLELVISKIQATLAPTKVETANEAAAPAPTVAEVAMMEADSDFNGRSIFAAIHEDTEKNFKPQDLAAGMKGLTKLINKPLQGLTAAVKKADGSNTNGMANSLKSLQAGLMGKQGNGTGTGAGTGAATGARDVRWTSDFQTGSKGKGSLTEGQQQALAKIFTAHQDQFRGCYESALLKFDEMTVTVSFEAYVTEDGSIGRPNFSMSGRSTPDSQEALTQCLKGVFKQIKVDKKLNGTKIKNQFVFKS